MVTGSVQFVGVIMNTAVSMATAICYGQYDMILQILGIGAISLAVTYACIKLGNAFQTGLDTGTGAFWDMSRSVVSGMSKVSESLSNAFSGVVGVYHAVIEPFQAFGNALFNPVDPKSIGVWEGIGGFIRGWSGSLVINGISRQIADEMDSTSNWLGKVGISLAGALLMMPATAYGSPDFGVLGQNENSQNWFSSSNSGIHMMNEMIFDGVSQIVSNEVYKALEDELGEEWYSDFVRVGVDDRFGQSGGADELLAHYGLDVDGLVAATKQALSKIKR